MQFSDSSKQLIGQPMFQILEKAQKLERQGKHLIHFELGDPDFNTPDNIKGKVISSIIKNETHYVPSSGLYDLRKIACEITKRSRGFQPDIEQTLVTVGANMQIYLALACTCNSGDEVIIPNPYFPSYMAIIKALQLIPVEIELKEQNEFRLDPLDIESKITNRTKAIIINSPSNPTGSIMTMREIHEVYKIAKKNDLWLLSDEVYSRQIYDGDFYSPSCLDQCRERIIIINGFSKSFAMTGWRLGVVTASKKLIYKMQILLETILSCVPPFIQRAGIEALEGDQSELVKMFEKYKNRRNIMVDGLNKIDGVNCIKPKGAMYCFPSIQKTGLTSQEFSDKMLQKGVVVCPGTIFGREGYVRLCYCNSTKNIIEGLERMRNE